MAKYIPKYATSFAIGGGIGERAMRQYEGVDTQPLTYPTNDDEWEEALGEFDVVNPPQETIDSDNDPGIVRGAAETGLDAIMGIPRGIVSAGMGVWQLADWATMDLLPDWETNPLGKSKTALGGIVESLSSFATGFIPIVGWMGRAGRVGSAFQQGSKLTRGVRKIHSLGGRAAASAARIPVGGPVVKTVFGQKYLSVANQARLETQGFTSAAKRVKYSRWLAASVATDFTVWGAHEERMSDWLQKFPGMQQPVFEYLASDENDSELEGRMKNVLEGILFEAGIGAIGGLVKGTVWGIKAMKRGRGVKEAGGTPAAIQEAMESTPGRPEGAEILEGGTEARNILQETQNSPRTGLPEEGPDGMKDVAIDFGGGDTMGANLRSHRTSHFAELDPDIVGFRNSAFESDFKPQNVWDVDPEDIRDAHLYHASPVCKNLTDLNAKRKILPEDIRSAEKIASNIKIARPRAFSLENVPGFAKEPQVLDPILNALEEAGYKWDIQIHNAADYGAPMKRERMVIRAVREGTLPEPPAKTGPTDWFETIEDLIDKAPDDTLKGKVEGKENWEVARIRKYANLPKEDARHLDTSKPIITMGGSASEGVPNSAHAGGPAPSLASTDRSIPRIIMPDGRVKRVTPRMMARLMGLPESYKVPEATKSKARGAKKPERLAKVIIGNGVHGVTTKNFIDPLLDGGQPATGVRKTELPGGPIARSSDAPTSKLDALENAARDRIKNRQLPGKGRLKGGTTLGADLVDVAIIGAVRVVKAGIVGRKAIQDLIKTLGEEMGRKFSHVDIQKIAEKIDAQLKDEKFVGAAKDVVEDRPRVPVTPREPGAKHGFDRNIQDPQGVAASREVLKDVSPIADQTLPRDPAWTKDVAKQKRLDFEGTASAPLQKIVTHVNAAIDKLELAGAANLQSMRKRAADVSGNNRQKIKKLNKILKDEIIPLQEGSVRYASVAPHQRMKPRDMEKRADREQQLADLEKHAINASTYRKTLTNLLANLKGPGRRVEIPDYGSKSWRDMTHGQQTRELRKRILDAEYGYLPHGADTIRMTAEQSKSLGNIARGVMRNIKLYDSTGALNVHELREHLNTLHEEERAYLKGLVGLPGGKSDTGESTLKEGSGEFSQGQAGEHQKRILAAGLAWVNDPDFRPQGIPHDKLQRSDWEYYVEQIWENNDIDLTNVDQVQKAMGVGEDLASAAAKAAKLTNVMKILQQGYYLEIGDMAEKYLKLKSNGQAREAEALGAELIASFFNLNNMAEQWVRAGAMTGTALQARKAIDITEYLKNHNYINKGMDEIIQQLDMLVSSDVPDEVIQQYKKSMSIQGKLVNAGIEVWTNALISGPKTIFGVTTVGNVFGMMYFPFERMLGHGISGSYAKLTGQSTRAAKEFKEAQVVAKLMTNMVLQSNYNIRGFSRALTSNRSRAVPGSSMMDTLSTGPKSDRQALSAEAFWSPEAGARNNLGNWVKDDGGHWEFQTTQTGAILDYVGGILNLPGRTMRAMDEVFKTGVVRSTVESELAAQAVKYIVHGRLGNKGLKGLWARTTGEGRETVTDRSGKVDIAKREAQDQELIADWGEGGPKVGKGKYADELVLFEEITAEVNGKMYKMIDENGSVYTKARVHEDALQQVMSEAKDNPNLQMGGTEFKQRHAEIMEAEWNPQLGAIGTEAEKMALTSTWQDPLTKGGITHSIQKLAQTHPTMRLIFPFMKTPRNLLKFVGDRNPVNPGLYTEYMRHQKAAKEALAEGAEQSYRAESRKAAELLGRVSMSVSLVTTATYLATSGVITGSGPKNYAARKNLEATGWQPWSFRIGNEYYSYAKAEPGSSFLGIMADAVEISNHTHTMDYGETPLEMMMKAAIGSLTNNLTDKSYLMGLSNFLNAMQEPERYTQRVAMSYLTSMVPFSSFMYQTKGTIQKTLNNEDMHYRKARGFIDPFREKMGWNNAKVPLAYDLMGKPIKKPHGHWPSLGPVSFDWLNPFTVSQKVNDPVYQAIVEMKLNDGAPKGLIRGRIDIRDEYREGSDLSFYDSWQESTGNIKLGGRTLHQTMDRLVRHKDWKRLPKLATEGIDSPARNIFRSIIQKYRRAAFNQTMGQYSNTRNKYMHALAVQRQLQQGS